jgi:hypothetical protein
MGALFIVCGGATLAKHDQKVCAQPPGIQTLTKRTTFPWALSHLILL